MAKSISEYLKVEPAMFQETGAFDAVLDVDSRFYVDPLLLRLSKAPELRGSYGRVNQHFSNILKLLAVSRSKGDRFWREAYNLFNFPEVQGLCIGYSSSSTSGSGMGPQMRGKILATAKEIVDVGIQDPAIFELVGILEDGVGADRISDMIVRIILGDLLSYSERIFTQFGALSRDISYQGRQFRLPTNPFNRYPIILVPNDVLRPLPVARSFDDIQAVCAYNEALRQRLNNIIGAAWKTPTSVKKKILRDTLLKDKEVLRDVVERYKAAPPPSYDFQADPLGEIRWLNASRQAAVQHPLELKLPGRPNLDEVLHIVNTICNKFKDLVENNGLYALLYQEGYKPQHEKAAQKLFFGIADSYCQANNLDLSPEVDAGRGPVDFKISKGYNSRVVVELKLTTNSSLKHGFETQITEYQKAEKTMAAIFMVIHVAGGSLRQTSEVRKLIDENNANGALSPQLVFVDASPKVSASKY